jgi:hypothetical protein
VLDGFRNAIILVSETSRVGIRHSADSSLWLAGAPLGGGWLLAVRTEEGVNFEKLDEYGAPSRVVMDGVAVASAAGMQPVWVTNLGGDVAVNERFYPYRIGSMNVESMTLAMRAPQLPREVAAALRGASVNSDKWTAGPVVALKAGFLLTFADQHSDARIVARYNQTWQLQDETRLTAPLAIVASSWNRERVVGVRDVGRLEVVFYSVSIVGEGVAPKGPATPCF